MANRNFRKNLALLCALAGGAGALNSMNVSTSAVGQEMLLKMETNAKKIVDRFKQQYNSWGKLRWKEKEKMTGYGKASFDYYSSLVCPEAAEELTQTVVYHNTRSKTQKKLKQIREKLMTK